jgi:hypothetical protein
MRPRQLGHAWAGRGTIALHNSLEPPSQALQPSYRRPPCRRTVVSLAAPPSGDSNPSANAQMPLTAEGLQQVQARWAQAIPLPSSERNKVLAKRMKSLTAGDPWAYDMAKQDAKDFMWACLPAGLPACLPARLPQQDSCIPDYTGAPRTDCTGCQTSRQSGSSCQALPLPGRPGGAPWPAPGASHALMKLRTAHPVWLAWSVLHQLGPQNHSAREVKNASSSWPPSRLDATS